MRKMKPVGKRSFLRGLLRALGMDRDSALPLPSQAETKHDVSINYTGHALTRTAWQEAEQNKSIARARAMMELQRKRTFEGID